MWDAGFAGFRLGLGLILAIGAQNAFVIRQGLRREHVLAVVLFCATSDAVLIALGVAGFASVTQALPWLAPVLRWGGVAFLGYYGLCAARSAWRGGQQMQDGVAQTKGLVPVLGTLIVLTWLNPHVWLDTVVLMGAVAMQFPDRHLAFGAGAVSASFLFFFVLGFGARGLAPVFARPNAWRWLDGIVAVVMISVAVRLACTG
ncbi:amino acid transporter [Rhodobacteraceae bacterium]|nr:amino acid transporter [Paracoccaceae bacterium]